MKYFAISRPENGDAEVVYELGQKTEATAREEVQRIADLCDQTVLFVVLIERVRSQS